MTSAKLVILDLDGTVYRNSEAIPHAASTIRALIEAGKTVRYLTNNSAATPQSVTERLAGMNVPCEPSWVYGSGSAAARLCLERGWDRVYVVGEPSLHETMRQAGVQPVGESPKAVVVGVCQSFDYAMMHAASSFVREGTPFLATNRDGTFPMEGGGLRPGSGAIVASIEVASGVKPEVVGKPNPVMARQILEAEGVDPANAIVVGDRPETDLDCGRDAGCQTWLVLTGVTQDPIPDQPGGPDLRGLLD